MDNKTGSKYLSTHYNLLEVNQVHRCIAYRHVMHNLEEAVKNNAAFTWLDQFIS